MFLSDFSVKRPVAMSCLIIGLTLLGINAWRKMGLELMPKIDLPFVTVTTVYPGASPDQIETDVAKRIEDQVMTIDGLKHVSSSCMENMCQTFLEFELGVDVDIAAMDVREKIDLVRADFPDDVEDPKILKYDVNAKAILTMALTGDVSVEDLYDYADNTLRDRISTIPGVADVTLIGGEKREVHVLIDRDKLAARGLTSMDVVSAIEQNVRTIPSGRVKEGDTEYSVKFDADYPEVQRIGDLEIANSNGQRCYLRDLSAVKMTTGEMRQLAEVDGRSAVAIKVIKKADANAVEVVSRVRKAMDKLERELPGGMKLVWVTDDERFTSATNWSAWSSIGQGILLTAAILFLFLYNLRVLLVVSVSMPLTVVIGLFFMQQIGYTLNAATLMSLGMSVGILVTNSIVVIEAIIKRLDQGAPPKEAACIGAGQAFIAVFASALTNIVVLFPMANMSSLVGLFISPFVMTMLIVTVVSLFISFTLTPMLCSLILKPSSEGKQGLIAAMESRWNRGFDHFLGRYKQMLYFFEKRRWASLLLLLIIFGWLIQSMGLAGKLGTSMMEESDRGEIYVKLEFPTRYSVDQTARRMEEVNAKLEGVPHLRHTVTTIGKADGVVGQATEGVYLAQILLRFNERTDRTSTIRDLMQDIRDRLADIP
ncbi:MAG: efflux RND transporter permease subunit, partial [Kiritimatiellae bacterium]|nr:efflux RND transporter permease subunit [Kiritimatiellia bacterium]